MIDVDGIPALAAFVLGFGAGVMLDALIRIAVVVVFRRSRNG